MPRCGASSHFSQNTGFTLPELMVAVALIAIAALGVMGIFGGVARGVQAAKARSLATNLAQEQIQILKQKSYYRVLVTTSPAFLSQFSPAVPYDPFYFAPENIMEGGMNFQRYVMVQLAQEVSGIVQTVPPTSADTNLKKITVTVAWSQSSRPMKLQVTNVMSNPDAVMTNSALKGQVTVGGVPLANSLITVAENTGWQDTTDAAGNYLINLYPGNYNLSCSAPGYFTRTAAVAVSSAATVTQNFALTTMITKTLSGDVWDNTHLVISRVVGATMTVGGFSQEYVEIFNPTTAPFAADGILGLAFRRRTIQDPIGATPIKIDYSLGGGVIPAGGFYLFANTSPVRVNGLDVTADAIWDRTPASGNPCNLAAVNNDDCFPYFDVAGEGYNVIPVNGAGPGEDGPNEGAGALVLFHIGSGAIMDSVGWRGGGPPGFDPAFFEGANPAAPSAMQGIELGELYYRLSSTDAALSTAWGPAYDSGQSELDWEVVSGGFYPEPRDAGSAPLPLLAGTPSVGAVVSTNDGLSIPARALAAGSPPVARFTLPSVATGSWTVFVTSGDRYQEISNVTVPAIGGTVWLPNAGTLPAWPAPNKYSIFLTTVTDEGYVAGTVRNAGGAAISPAITVTNGSRSTTAATAGSGGFLLKLPAGTYSISANPANTNPNYVTAASAAVTVAAGQVTSGIDFTLSQGGQVLGFVTRDGVNPLPGCAVVALNASGLARAQEVSGPDGHFRIVNLSTGAYTLEPVLGSGERGSPAFLPVTVNIGSQVFAGSFTVVGASGYIKGTVMKASQPIRTGVTIVATTSTIVGVPPDLNAAGLTGNAFYTASSDEDGSYKLELRGSTSTPYRVYAYYPTPTGAGWSIVSASSASVLVIPSFTVPGVNFAWP